VSEIIKQHIACPSCTSSDGYCIWEDGHGYCFSCKHYSPPEGPDKDNARNKLEAYTYEYIANRGISESTYRRYGALTKVDLHGRPVSIGYRYPNGDHKVRTFGEKSFYWTKHVQSETHYVGLYATDIFPAGSNKYICITEGEEDAHSLYQVLRNVPCVSVQSSSSAIRDCVADRDYLNSFERIYLALDNDGPGREAARGIAKLFDYSKIYLVKFSNRKDANEYLQHGEEDDLKNIWFNSKRYLPETLKSSLDEFDELLTEEPKWGVAYPFPLLTQKTYGLRRGESVLITAQEGVGKTELMHAIEYQLLKETKDNVGAIFLEEPAKRNLEALAGLELQRPVHLPNSGCTRDQVRAALRNVVQTDDRLHVHLRFGSDDPELLLEDIRFLVTTRNCVWIMLDHITMVVSGRSEDDERRSLDWFSTRIETMVKDLNFGLIIVSHVNDAGQTRGSRYIGKVFDIRIDATRDLLADDPVVRNTTHLKIAKNRYSGGTGPADILVFDRNKYMYQVANDNFDPGDRSQWRAA
jgi:twinkle protein